MSNKIRLGAISMVLMRLYHFLTLRYSLHTQAHVGQFAGSLLRRSDWDHD
jgi:hypothetical protein